MTNYAIVPVSSVKVGTRLIADGGFTCINKGEIVVVHEDSDGLYFNCCSEEGNYGKAADDSRTQHHYLEGQLDDKGENYVGFWLLSFDTKEMFEAGIRELRRPD